jgi:hypothetical protein
MKGKRPALRAYAPLTFDKKIRLYSVAGRSTGAGLPGNGGEKQRR